jgi:hypothetical protein
MFRRSNRIIELIDEYSNRTCKVQEVGMNVASHDRVLQALEYWANRVKCKGKLQGVNNRTLAWALDKICTIGSLQILSVKETREKYLLIEQQEIDRVRELGLSEEVLQVHGVAPVSKGVGTIHLIYKNMDSICNRLSNNAKLEKAKEIHDELEVDIAAYNEHWLNLRHHLNVFNQMFKGGEAELQSITAHNTHENIGRIQEGGASLLMCVCVNLSSG